MWHLGETTNSLQMLYTIRLTSTDKQKSFVCIWILRLTGKKGDGLSFGLDRIRIRLDIGSQGKRKIKEIALGI